MNEDEIDNMSIVLFESVLFELGRKLNYEAAVGFVGNSFAKDAWKMVEKANPMVEEKKASGSVFAAFLGGGG